MNKYWNLGYIAILVAMDWLIKYWVISIKNLHQIWLNTTFLGIKIIFVKNYGISFGFFQNMPYANFIIVTISIFVIAFINYLLPSNKSYPKMSHIIRIMLIAGGIGNLIDRFFYGFVIDYLNISLFGIELWTCNLADIFISFGILLWFLR